ncbi:(Fe-S)-binding protein [Alistipes sp. ZOR0009]|uniref:(Fe-S)-binding protein n=1 Tax=Alistipes sp. ZOR0009 TaxID=1339253 RepID=UPI00068A9D87|nr:(Fe-S)-binding protein [Alistipes sp. ZOR0009]
MDRFDIFVLPFTIGLAFVVIYYIVQLFRWRSQIPQEERTKLNAIFKSPVKFFWYGIDVIKESLLHINLFRTNLLLGFMHMSLAFGWFMLIICGNLESKVYTNSHLNPPYFPIFLKYFIPDMTKYPLHKVFAFVMDFFLLMVLTGIALALTKRFISKKFSIAKKPKYTAIDRVGLYSLWLIFPFRFLAESLNAGIYKSGGFLTQNVGNLLNDAGFAESSAYTAWWGYSIALGIFLCCVPFTRYMHILSEPFFIFLKHAKVDASKFQAAYNDIQVKSCSKCGVCLNACPLVPSNVEGNPQPIYLLNALRHGTLTPEMADTCLNCRRCEEKCPVGITIEPLRMALKKGASMEPNLEYTTLAEYPKAKVGYFAGCMGKLTPATTQSLEKIAKAANESFVQLDKESGICCGRPQKLAGQDAVAQRLIERNKELLAQSKVELLVTSCPICLKTFKDDYQLNIPVLHHTQYIKKLLDARKIEVKNDAKRTAYHDSCELARGCGITEEPRYILKSSSSFVEMERQHRGQCCGNSLAHTTLTSQAKASIAAITVSHLPEQTQYLITSCPACNKAFKGSSKVEVQDIAVFTANNLTPVTHVEESLHGVAATASAK